MTSIFIFRRDFRFKDNISLQEAIKFSNKNKLQLLPIFIFTKKQIDNNKYFSQKCFNFLIESLEEFNNDFKTKYNTEIQFFYGDELKIIKDIIKNNNVKHIYFNKDLTGYSLNRDEKIKNISENIQVQSFEDYTLFPINSIKTSTNKVFTKFTPFYNYVISNNKLLETIKVSNEIKIDNLYKKNVSKSVSLDFIKKKFKYIRDENVLKGGRDEALKILNSIKDYKNYVDSRDTISDSEGTTKLSAYLKFGSISIREFYEKVEKEFGKKHELVRQLIWREFYYNVGYVNQKSLYQKENIKGNNLKINWSSSEEQFKKLLKGETGFPLVDASVKELLTTGYMHNRMRMVFASFLIKLIRIEWPRGELFFAKNLVDYDPIINNQNWLWITGSGTDIRQGYTVFNPWLQSKKHDKDSLYVKKWLPQFKDVPSSDIHNWFKKHDKYKDVHYPPMFDYSEQKKIYLKNVSVKK